MSLVGLFLVREFRSRYRQSSLNAAWGFVTPVVVMAVYGLVLHGALGVESDGVPYLSFAWVGVAMWSFFAAGFGGAVLSLLGKSDLLSKIYFPREVVPLSVVGASLFDLGVASLSVVVLVVIQGVQIHPIAIASLAGLAVLVVWTAALSVLLSAFVVFVRDLDPGVQLMLRVGFFATPVMYPVSALPPGLRWTASLNPVAVAIGAVREALLLGHAPRWGLVAAQFAAGWCALFLAVRYVQSVEGRMVDVI